MPTVWHMGSWCSTCLRRSANTSEHYLQPSKNCQVDGYGLTYGQGVSTEIPGAELSGRRLQRILNGFNKVRAIDGFPEPSDFPIEVKRTNRQICKQAWSQSLAFGPV